MIKFVLTKEETEESFYLDLNFKNSEEFFEFCENDSSYDKFVDKMETGDDTWNGILDFYGFTDKSGIEYVGYSSYEIEDFDTAFNKWKDYFNKKGKLI